MYASPCTRQLWCLPGPNGCRSGCICCGGVGRRHDATRPFTSTRYIAVAGICSRAEGRLDRGKRQDRPKSVHRISTALLPTAAVPRCGHPSLARECQLVRTPCACSERERGCAVAADAAIAVGSAHFGSSARRTWELGLGKETSGTSDNAGHHSTDVDTAFTKIVAEVLDK